MALDLRKTAPQIAGMAEHFGRSQGERAARLDLALRGLADPLALSPSGISDALLRRRIEAAGPPRPRVTFLVAAPPGDGPVASALARVFSSPSMPRHLGGAPTGRGAGASLSYLALATDGSQIAPDRHGPVPCFLLNAGGAAIRYGPEPGAEIFSQPRLFSRPEELVLRDPEGAIREQRVDATLLGIMRTVLEAQTLAGRLHAAPEGLPVLALQDGSLVRWELSGDRYPEHVRHALLQDGYLQALDRIREAGRGRPLAFASYISASRSTEVVNVLRVARCPHEGVETRGCDSICGRGGQGRRECDEVAAGVLDRDLFARLLRPGERSAIFSSQSAILREYGPHEVRFCYIHVGAEVARLEMPEWIADDAQAVDLLHTLVLDQCRKGGGYPVVLQEAHEAAVVTEADRRAFWALVEAALAGAGGRAAGSEKARSKRVRAV